MYINPLGELAMRKEFILKSWKSFINRRFACGYETSGPKKWTFRPTQQHSTQADSVSCGIFVMKVYNTFL